MSDSTKRAMQSTRDEIESYLREKIGWMPRIYYAGSYAKNTMLDIYHDLDLVVYYPSTTSKSLKDIYWEVHSVLNKRYITKQKDVAIRLPYKEGFMIDVVPGRAMDESYLYANLYRSEVDSRLQTSIKIHITTIRDSNFRGTMRLMKLWNVRHQLGLRSFLVELLVIRALNGSDLKGYDEKMLRVLKFIRDNIETARILDPANTNNVISDLVTSARKKAVASKASACLNAKCWEDVVW